MGRTVGQRVTDLTGLIQRPQQQCAFTNIYALDNKIFILKVKYVISPTHTQKIKKKIKKMTKQTVKLASKLKQLLDTWLIKYVD